MKSQQDTEYELLAELAVPTFTGVMVSNVRINQNIIMVLAQLSIYINAHKRGILCCTEKHK